MLQPRVVDSDIKINKKCIINKIKINNNNKIYVNKNIKMSKNNLMNKKTKRIDGKYIKKNNFFIIKNYSNFNLNEILLFAFIFLITCVAGQYTGYNNDGIDVQPTPVLHQQNEQDVTTVLLVDNNGGSHGRFLNLKPDVGILTSTARTFIQEGVTTEYATQVLGTTLDHGRLYAQLLTKSSRVLYEGERFNNGGAGGNIGATSVIGNDNINVNLPTKAYYRDNEINQRNWRNYDNEVAGDQPASANVFIKNTDDIAFLVFPTKIPLSGNRADEEYRYKDRREKDVVIAHHIKAKTLPQNQEGNRNIVHESFSISQSSSSSDSEANNNIQNLKQNARTSKDINFGDQIQFVKANKVRPADNLPTFTVKNEFAPSGFSVNDMKLERQPDNYFSVQSEQRNGKLLFRPLQDTHNYTSVTYYGFADFTTIVGDTVIVFSPSTALSSEPAAQVTSIKGEATVASRIYPTKVSKDTISRTATKLSSMSAEDKFIPGAQWTETTESMAEELELQNFDTTTEQELLDYVTENDEYDYKEDIQEPTEHNQIKPKPETIEERPNHNLFVPTITEIESSVIEESVTSDQFSSTATSQLIQPQPSVSQSTRMLSTPSNEDISKIFASLASARVAEESRIAIQRAQAISNTEAVSQIEVSTAMKSVVEETQVLGGVTTIFFEDDPFLPSPVETVTTQKNTIATTLNDNETDKTYDVEEEGTTPSFVKEINDITTTKNTITTEKLITSAKETTMPIDETTEVTKNDDETETEGQTESLMPEHLTQPTTETNNVDSDVENKITEKPAKFANVQCSSNLKVIPTTAYKTYTYLTTFFIPIEESGLNDESTTTSIKSHEVTSTEVMLNTYSCNGTESWTTDIQIVATMVSENAEREEFTAIMQRPDFEEQTTEKIADEAENDEMVKTTEDHTEKENTVTDVEQENEEEKVEEEDIQQTTPIEIITEKKHVTEAGNTESPLDSSMPDQNIDDLNNNSGTYDSDEEIELIYKTLYTTYTYLTTFFHESTSSISSRKEVVTNVVTSTLDPSLLKNDGAIADLVASMTALDGTIQPTRQQTGEILPTNVGIGRPTTPFHIPESDLIGIDQILEADREGNNLLATPALNSNNFETQGDIKTYYTTYTYFTTIFVDGETEISSRTEVYTNYVNVESTASVQLDVVSITSSNDKSNAVLEGEHIVVHSKQLSEENSVQESLKIPVMSYDSTISRAKSLSIFDEADRIDNNIINPTAKYSTMVRGMESSVAIEQNENNIQNIFDVITMVTDVRSSSSDGDRKIIENVNKQWNLLYEDQISSESNTEEIMPSPTLLLQTSYTTFTYFTTMYVGSTASNILSRLETVTNVVTETLTPTRTVNLEEVSLPITYFTTFTYWTTLFKDGTTTTTSREETISNIVAPTSVQSTPITTTSLVDELASVKVAVLDAIETKRPDVDQLSSIITVLPSDDLSEVVSTSETNGLIKPTTYYTTYTYFTTSYIGDQTVLNSRFETVTNVVEPKPQAAATTIANATGRAINIDGRLNTLDDNSEKSTKSKFIPDFIPGIVNEDIIRQTADKIEATKAETPLRPTGVVSINHGKIIDAERISTIFYTTQVIGSYINDIYTQVTESSSSINVDLIKKSAQPSTEVVEPNSRIHKTGLVRLIEGKIVSNSTTTLYQSKVIGTIIEGRYAQIIESTSSFLIEKTLDPTATKGTLILEPTSILATLNGAVNPTASVIVPTPAVVESSLSDGNLNGQENEDDEGYEEEGDEDDEDGEDEDGNTRAKSRLTFQTRKRTFTPVIRPFASRNRPTFNPRRKNGSPSSATIITRSDFTPTITATPAIKSETTRGRFSVSRRASSSAIFGSSSSTVQQLSSALPSGGRKFSRPKSNISGGISSTASQLSFSSTRIRSSNIGGRIQPTSSVFFGSSSRRGGFRGNASSRPLESTSVRQLASVLPNNSRFRIRPTLSSNFDRGISTSASYTTPSTDLTEEDESFTTGITDSFTDITGEDDVTTTENSRRNQNPLLRFRRPPLARGQTPITTTSRPITITTRRSSILSRSRAPTTPTTTTTTTARPRARSFQRPAITNLPVQNRQRPASSNLFPPRGLYRGQSPAIQPEVEEESQKDDQDTDNLTPDNDYEDSKIEEVVEAAPANFGRSSAYDSFRRRNKRQTDYGTRNPNYTPRFRRPTTARAAKVEPPITEEVAAETPKPSRATSRYTPRPRTSPTSFNQNHNTNQQAPTRIRPTSAQNNQGRAQFTLREKDTITTTTQRSGFRRPSPGINLSTQRRTTTPTARQKSARLRNNYSAATEATYSSRNTVNSRTRTTNARRTTSRTRARNELSDFTYVQPSFDGTITVTHHIPTEVTISVVNGMITEYKNIITAKISTEVLGPKQYSTSVARDGKAVIFLTSEMTGIANNGATEITQYLLHETPTTSIIFTPTTIRGRKTSFSHVIPSTVYDVETVVSTIQPQLAANAPLANILLSQLLLGNLGLPQQQLNPLLGLQMGQPQMPATPTTEYKTRTTTYVTTVTSATSTVIPLTFRGKEILTTIIDSSVNVITATEFLTDTIVATPSYGQNAQNSQLNSLLLPLLLQQQAQQQQQQQPQLLQQNQQLNLQNINTLPHDLLTQDTNFDENQRVQHRFQKSDTSGDDRGIRESEEYPEQDNFEDILATPPQRPATIKKNRIYKPDPPVSPLETSVVTLYVSGRRPGEFSTVLSTYIVGQDSQLRKREANDKYINVQSSRLPDIDLLMADGSDFINSYIMPTTNDINVESSQVQDDTESLDSIIGSNLQDKYLTSELNNYQSSILLIKDHNNNNNNNNENDNDIVSVNINDFLE